MKENESKLREISLARMCFDKSKKNLSEGKRNYLLLIKGLQKIGRIARGWQTIEKGQRDTNCQSNQVETIPANVKPHT